MSHLRASSIIILNEYNEVLLYKRDNCELFPYHWDLIGGSCEKGESFRDTIIREVKEEIGIDIPNPEMFMMFTTRHHVEVVFSIKLNSPRIILSEGIEYRFFSLQQTLKLKDIGFSYKPILELFLLSFHGP